MKRSADARWQGSLENGKGSITTESGVLSDTQYSFNTRFEQGNGTNPEELVAGAHAGCYSMALSMILGESDLTPDSIETRADVTLDQVEDGFAVTRIHLAVRARVPGASREDFDKAAQAAKDNCPISKLMTAEITMDAKLED